MDMAIRDTEQSEAPFFCTWCARFAVFVRFAVCKDSNPNAESQAKAHGPGPRSI